MSNTTDSGVPPAFDGTTDDTLFGDSGDDQILARSGLDSAFGGDGNDTVTADGLASAAHGEDGDDFIVANGSAYGGDGHDIVTGLHAEGGDGNDTLTFSEHAHSFANLQATSEFEEITNIEFGLFGGSGDDVINIDVNADGAEVDGGRGNDEISMAEFVDGERLNAGNLEVDGGLGDDTITMFDGDHSISGGVGSDHIYTGDGDNYIFTSDDVNERDFIFAGDGDDTIEADYVDFIANISSGDEVTIQVYGLGEEYVDDYINIVDVPEGTKIILEYFYGEFDMTESSVVSVVERPITLEDGSSQTTYEVHIDDQPMGLACLNPVDASAFAMQRMPIPEY